MENRRIRRGFKDVLFKDIFSQKKYLLQLVNALNNSNYTNPDDLEITTIEGIIYATLKNDVSFLLGSEMYLFEQQSTYNPNMPLRGLMYFAELYQEYLTAQGINIYGSTLKKIPTPRFIVFYNGVREMPEIKKLRLSDAFISPDKNCEFEWTATMLNVNGECNRNLKNSCGPLLEYSRFVDIIKEERKNNIPIEAAVEKALDFATKQKHLGDYFESCRQEVMNMSLTEFDQEEFERQIRAEGFDEGRTEGLEEGESIGLAKGEKIGLVKGKNEAKLESAVIAVAEFGISPELVAEKYSVPLEMLEDALKMKAAVNLVSNEAD